MSSEVDVQGNTLRSTEVVKEATIPESPSLNKLSTKSAEGERFSSRNSENWNWRGSFFSNVSSLCTNASCLKQELKAKSSLLCRSWCSGKRTFILLRFSGEASSRRNCWSRNERVIKALTNKGSSSSKQHQKAKVEEVSKELLGTRWSDTEMFR